MTQATTARSSIPAATGRRADYLTFFIAGEEYGVPIRRAREIRILEALTRVPSAPACVRGVINLRGSVVPVVDLAIKLGQPECEITKLTCVVVIEVMTSETQTVMGLMVEAVSQTIELAAEDIEAAPSFGTLIKPEHLLGLGRIEDKFVLLLDIDRLLSAEELHRVDDAVAEADAADVTPASREDGDA